MPGLLSAAELAQIQADVAAAACDKTCTIWRKTTLTPDGLGTSVPTYTQIAATVAGMREPTGTQLQNYDFEIGSLEAWQVHLPYGTDVTHQDHLVIETQTLEVQVLLDPHSYPALTTVLASEIR